MNLLIVAIATIILNLPFGYWRSNVKKFSVQWFFAVHLAVPFIVLMRRFSGIGFKLYTFPIIIGSYFLGQFVGAKIHEGITQNRKAIATSCLFIDIARLLFGNRP